MSGEDAARHLREARDLMRRNTSDNMGMWIASAFIERFGDTDHALAEEMLAMLDDPEWVARPGAIAAACLLAGANWQREQAGG